MPKFPNILRVKLESYWNISQGLKRLFLSLRNFVMNFGLHKGIEIFIQLLVCFFSKSESRIISAINLKVRCRSSDIDNVIQHLANCELTSIMPLDTKIYVDFGAYSGISLKAVHSKFPNIRSFGLEPLSSNFEYLSYNTSHYKTSIYKYAIGDENKMCFIASQNKNFWGQKLSLN